MGKLYDFYYSPFAHRHLIDLAEMENKKEILPSVKIDKWNWYYYTEAIEHGKTPSMMPEFNPWLIGTIELDYNKICISENNEAQYFKPYNPPGYYDIFD